MDFAMPSMPSSSSDDFEIFESEPTDQYLELESAIDTSISAVHYIGRKFASMMVGGVLAVFDLTRARERILFDRYSALLDGGKSVSQQLLFPQTLTLSEAEYSLIEEWSIDFAALGFDISLQSGCTVNINGIPAELSADRIDIAIYELLQSLALPHEVESMRREQMALTLAKSEAAKRVQYSQADAEAIAEQLMACKEHKTTPSGKTIITYITLDDIQQKLA